MSWITWVQKCCSPDTVTSVKYFLVTEGLLYISLWSFCIVLVCLTFTQEYYIILLTTELRPTEHNASYKVATMKQKIIFIPELELGKLLKP